MININGKDFNGTFRKELDKVAGYREKNILENLKSIELVMSTKDYRVYKLTAEDGTYFEYEEFSNRITG